MLDLMSGPNAPVASACLMAGWRAITVDCLLDQKADLADEACQEKVKAQAKGADFIWYAPDCSTKSKARLKRGHFADGQPLPPPLRSEATPMGLAGLVGLNKERVDRDNEACDFCLGLLRAHQGKGGVSGRENPRSSIHWWIPMEVEMFAQGTWTDTSLDN